jgi:antitoxin FitA
MATLLIRDLPDKTKKSLRVAAAKSGVSLEAYVRKLLSSFSKFSDKKDLSVSQLARKIFGESNGIDLDLPKRTSKRKSPQFNS